MTIAPRRNSTSPSAAASRSGRPRIAARRMIGSGAPLRRAAAPQRAARRSSSVARRRRGSAAGAGALAGADAAASPLGERRAAGDGTGPQRERAVPGRASAIVNLASGWTHWATRAEAPRARGRLSRACAAGRDDGRMRATASICRIDYPRGRRRDRTSHAFLPLPVTPPLLACSAIAWTDPARAAAFAAWLDDIAARHGLDRGSLRRPRATPAFAATSASTAPPAAASSSWTRRRRRKTCAPSCTSPA